MPLDALVLLVLVNTNVLDPGTYRFRADERDVGQAVIKGKTDEVLEFRIEMPAYAKMLTVERVNPGSGSAKSTTYEVISVSSISKPIRDERPVVSLEALPARVDALLKTIGSDLTSERLGLEFGPPQSIKAINEAEERLRFPLDPELVAVLTKLGPLRFGDDGMMEAHDFARTDKQFERIWGAPETVREEEAREVYRNSTMVWVEAGDGYGAVIYAPSRGNEGAPAAGYWWIHQDTIGVPMPYGISAKGGPLAGALIGVFVEELLTQIEDQGIETQLFVDPSMPEPFPVWLSTENGGTPRLKADWTRHY